MQQSSRTNTNGRMYGSYPATVVNTTHPQGLYLVSVRVNGLWDSIRQEDLPFAEFLLPIGCKNDAGHAIPVEKGDQVWVDFPRNGDTRYPRITGSIYTAPNGKSNLPNELNDSGFKPATRADKVPPADPFTFKDDIYSRFNIIEQRSAAGGWSIINKSNGTSIEILPNGAIVINAQGDLFKSATGNILEQASGSITLKTDEGFMLIANGDIGLESKSGGINLKANGGIVFDAGGLVDMSGSAFNFTKK